MICFTTILRFELKTDALAEHAQNRLKIHDSMIQSYAKYKQFKSLVEAKENGKAVQSGLDFLRFVAEEYSRLEVYNNQECDGDDFFTYQVEKELAQVLRNETTPVESVAMAQKEIQEHARLINVSLPSSYRKGEMAEGLATLFQHDPFYTVNQLPKNEQKLIAQLINLKFDEFVDVPRNDKKLLMMQKVHLVVTYEEENTWKLFMPECIRTILRDTTESQIGDVPGMMDYRKVLRV